MERERINLIMAGGGVRLPAYVGALAALEEMGVEIVQVAGASAGSIVGSHLAAGWSVDQMRRLAIETNFAAFKDLSLRGFLFEGGLYTGNTFERWMHTGLKGARFKDLPRDLFVTAVDLFGRRPFLQAGDPRLPRQQGRALLHGHPVGLAPAALGAQAPG